MWPMSPRLVPGLTMSAAIIRELYVTSMSRCAFTPIFPTGYMRDESPCHPSSMGVTSILTTSPWRRTLSPGIPWHTTWFTDVQIDFGKPLYPRGAGVAPLSSVNSTDFVEMVGRYARNNMFCNHVKALGGKSACISHANKFFRSMQDNPGWRPHVRLVIGCKSLVHIKSAKVVFTIYKPDVPRSA